MRGEGFIRKRGNRFEAVKRLPGGKRVSKTFDLEGQASSWLAKLKSKILDGILDIPEKPRELRFDNLCRLYKVHKLSRWRAGTVRFFDGHVKSLLIPEFGSRLIQDITTEELQSFIDDQLARVQASTVDRYFQCLGAVFKYAVRMGYLVRSPMAGVEKGKRDREVVRRRILRPEELRATLAACKPKDRAFFALLIFCGLRKAETCRIEWSWFDFDENMVYVRIAKRGSNDIPMPAVVRRHLLELKGERVGYVFPGRHLRQGKRRSLPGPKHVAERRRLLASVLKRAGVNPSAVGFHTFRRSFITLLEQLPGVTYSVVRALARHGVSSTDITARYLHPSRDQLRAALAQLEQSILGPDNVDGAEPKKG